MPQKTEGFWSYIPDAIQVDTPQEWALLIAILFAGGVALKRILE